MSTRSTSRASTIALVGLAWLLPAVARAEPGSDPVEAPPSGLVEPVLAHETSIEYPPELALAETRPSGRVVVRFVVGVDGHTKEAEIVESVHPAIDAAALAAVSELRYQPATFEGQPVEVTLSLAIDVEAPPRVEPAAVTRDAPTDTPPPRETAAPIRLRGTVREAGRRAVMAGTIVTAFPADDMPLGKVPYRKRKPPEQPPAWTVQTTTDAEGRFALAGVPPGRVRVVLLTPGFERLEYVLDLRDREVVDVTWFQTRMNTNPYRTDVSTAAETMPEITRHSIGREEMNRIPGTNGDALRSVQNFPGMARSPFGAGMLIIRGAAPGDSVVVLAGHEIPALFHFGNLTSVFNSDLVSRIDYMPGNFDARYGDAIGGAVSVTPRAGRRDGHHGYVDMDVFDAGALVEGPVGKGSFALSARRSYIDAILPAVIPKDAGVSFVAAPRYWDYQAQLDYPLGGGMFTARVFGSDDRLRLLFAEDNAGDADARSRVETTQWFHRADLAYSRTWGKWKLDVTPSYRRDRFELGAVGLFKFNVTTDRLSFRGEISRALGKRSEFRVGTELVNDWIDVDVLSPPLPGDSSGGRGGGNPTAGGLNDQLSRRGLVYVGRPAVYSTFKIGLHDAFALLPSARLTYYAGRTNRVVFEPRLRFEADATDTTRISGGVGLYTQSANTQQTDEVFGNPKLRPENAVHVSLGAEQRFAGDWTISVTGFYKHLWSLVSTSPDVIRDGDEVIPERYDNAAIGRVYGGEFMIRKDLTRKLFGWVSYTLSRSQIKPRPGDDWALFDYDQTHILTLVASYKLPRNWQVGTRFRLVSGNPMTPVANGVTQLYDGMQLPLPGPYNSDRLRPFHQLDLRIDKTWVLKRVQLHTYLDVQNLYNAKNPETQNYSWNFQKRVPINSLPIIPSLGLRLEW